MFDQLQAVMNQTRNPKQAGVSFGPFTGGLVTVRDPALCTKNEAAELTNLIIVDNERVRTRDGTSLVCSGVAGSIVQIGEAKVADTWYTIISTTQAGTPSSTYRLYRKNGTGVTQIGDDNDFSGEVRFLGFNNVLMIFDGGFIKYWDGTNIITVEDQGIGANNLIAENLDGDLFGGVTNDRVNIAQILTATYSRVAYKFTTPTFDSSVAAYMLPTVVFWYIKIGSSATTFVIKIRKYSDDSIVASKTITRVADLPYFSSSTSGAYLSNYSQVSVKFESGDMSTALLSDTAYYMSFECADSAASYPGIAVWTSTPSYGYRYLEGTGWISYFTPLIDISFGLPPKANYGITASSRIFCVGEEYPTRVYYCGAGNHLDWSSPNYGGYIDVGRDIGGIVSFYDQIWVFGTDQDPSIRKLSGAEPANYTLTDTLQYIAGNHKSLVSAPNDVFFLHKNGIGSISTMQEFGDIRSGAQSDNIENLIRASYDTSAIAAYDPMNGLYVLKLNDSTAQTLYAVHTKIKNGKYYGGRVLPSSPVSKFVLNLPLITGAAQTITAMGTVNGELHIGTDKGYVYKFDRSVLTDASGAVTYALKSNVQSTRFGELTAWQMVVDNFSANGGSYTLKAYRNHSTVALISETITLPTSLSSSQPDSATSYLADFNRLEVNFNFRSIQISYESITPNGANHMYFGGAELLALRTGGL